jgi:threonine dehydratase
MLSEPSYDDVNAAARRIEGHAQRTPVATSRTLNAELGAQVFFKCENLQRMGAFKFRGAYNALAQFGPEQRRAGVVAFSSGNHAQAIALAARLLGMPAVIVMPHDAPAAKVAATRGYGGEVVGYDRYKDDREQIGRDLAREHGLTLVPPYDHEDVIAGQGTAAKELFEEVGPLDFLFVPLGGGGLLSGCVLATRALAPRSRSRAVCTTRRRTRRSASSPRARCSTPPASRSRRAPGARSRSMATTTRRSGCVSAPAPRRRIALPRRRRCRPDNRAC